MSLADTLLLQGKKQLDLPKQCRQQGATRPTHRLVRANLDRPLSRNISGPRRRRVRPVPKPRIPNRIPC